MTTNETASLILTLLAHDDAQTARELAAAIGTTATALRTALRQLVESEDVVTSGRAGATRYLLAADPVEQAPQPARKPRPLRPVIPATVDLEGALQATQQRLEAGATLHELSARPVPHPHPHPVVAALASDLASTHAVEPALAEVQCARCRARMCHECVCPSLLQRECVTPTEDVAARQLALFETERAGEAHDRATERQERRGNLAMGLVSALMVLAPVAWVLSHLVR